MNMIQYQTPATINPASAQLPATYQNAKNALSECVQIDECVTWADKAAALASYAKQANDDEMMKMATRIRDRAIRRAGELLKQIEPQSGKRTDLEPSGGVPTRLEVAKEAGLSRDQMHTALRVANIPDEDFERQVESQNPPTVTKLAEQGKKAAPKPVIDLKGRDPQEFNRSMHFVQALEAYQREVEAMALDTILPVLIDSERERVRKAIAAIDATHDRIITRI
ncbi:hypothetical protein [Brucella pseudintermedia]|uniref:hypothetical protein n=1 Tax=Brucella pseudintermedia TaxID=370111 RepID=UPI00124C2A22|nr:hypothetical protein [Brucella pseudintermedia]KAB2680355.1 hypothetical protein F9K78_16845 [Brucella pseudintermedia]